jgi:hypothetical protein
MLDPSAVSCCLPLRRQDGDHCPVFSNLSYADGQLHQFIQEASEASVKSTITEWSRLFCAARATSSREGGGAFGPARGGAHSGSRESFFSGRRPEKGFSGSTGGKRFFRGPRVESSLSPSHIHVRAPPPPPFVCSHAIICRSSSLSLYHAARLHIGSARVTRSTANKINECAAGVACQSLPDHQSPLSNP